jgi:hypothetical protein
LNTLLLQEAVQVELTMVVAVVPEVTELHQVFQSHQELHTQLL